jgi:hypothetical protein
MCNTFVGFMANHASMIVPASKILSNHSTIFSKKESNVYQRWCKEALTAVDREVISIEVEDGS